MSLSSKWAGLKSILHFSNSVQLLANRLFFKNALLLYRYKGMDVLIDHEGGDAGGTRLCLTTDMYKHFLPFMSLPLRIIVLDLGANGGGFPLMLRAEGMSIRKLVCVEMNPNTWTRLVFNIYRNISCKAQCLNLAIGNANKELEVFLGKGSTSDSIYNSPADKREELEKHIISISTFDAMYENNFHNEIIDICKIDIEGSEYDLFLNPGHERIKKCRYILMEIHPNTKELETGLNEEIKLLGFEQVSVPKQDSENVFLFKNHYL
jgi:FkbM family methyltransferase